MGHRGWARPQPHPFTLKPPGRLRLGWGWGRSWRVPLRRFRWGSGITVGGHRGSACGSFSQRPLDPGPVCDHGQQESSGHRVPLPNPPEAEEEQPERGCGGPVALRWGGPVLLWWGDGNAVLALSATWRARSIALGAQAMRRIQYAPAPGVLWVTPTDHLADSAAPVKTASKCGGPGTNYSADCAGNLAACTVAVQIKQLTLMSL